MMEKNVRRIIFMCFLAMIAGLGPIQAAGTAKKNQDIYFKALQEFESGSDLKGVQLYYRFILVSDLPLSKAVRVNDLRKAMGHLEADRASGKKVDNKTSLALVLTDRIIERFDQAGKRLDTLRDTYPNSVLLAFIKGELLLTQGEESLAQSVFGTMPPLPNSRVFLALADSILERRGRGKKSDPAVRRGFLMKMAFRNWDAMDFDGAQKVFRSIMSEFPDDREAPQSLVDLLIQTGKADEAMKIVDEWKKAKSESLIAPLPLARINYSLGRFEEVLLLLTPLQKGDPQDMNVKLLMAEALFQTGQIASAAPLFEDLVKADPGNQGFLLRSIACLEPIGRAEDALPPLEAYVKKNQNDFFLRFELASLLMRMGKLEEANFHFTPMNEDGNPFHERAKEQIAIIDNYKSERFMSDTPTESAGYATETHPGKPFDQDSKPSQGGDVGKTEKEQIQRMKELFN
ncbi:MAG: tetratricopeptide repeat protein [Candidatus Ozemobacteraceae bacterium]